MNDLKELAALLPKDTLSFDANDLREFGKDWTKVFEPNPIAIAFPRTTEDVVKIAKFCFEHSIPLVPSGGRTGLAGGAVAKNQELVISFSKMTKMGEVDVMARTLKVQAGAITEGVHKHCEPFGLTWPVDFGSKGSSHVGGNISTNAGGVRVIRYGLTRNWVLGLQVVTATGEVLELNGALEKNNTGPDLRQLFIGSEGTLGMVTEATLKLAPVPKKTELFLFGVDSLQSVFKLFEHVRREAIPLMAYECMSASCMESVKRMMPQSAALTDIPGYGVMVEVEIPEHGDFDLDPFLADLFEKNLVSTGMRAETPAQTREIWKVRELITESLMIRGLVHKHDVSLPINKLKEFLEDLSGEVEQMREHLEVFIFGHIGDGNLHINYLQPSGQAKDVFYKYCKVLDEKMFVLIENHAGSVSAEHGIGLLKKHMLKYSRTPVEIELFRALKKALDPKGILNPGKIWD